MQFVGSQRDVDLEIGEPVYKMGCSTGLTIGRLGSMNSSFRSGGFSYEDHVQVLWNEEHCRFAFSNDCGSIYCVKRGPMSVPIGIHRSSDTNFSCGCSVYKAIEIFPMELTQNVLRFVNPPFYFY